MRPFVFFRSLVLLLLVQALGLWWWYRGSYDATGRELAMAGMIAFAVLNVGFYYLAAYLSKHSMDKTYLMMTWLNFLFKMILALGLPFAFYLRDHVIGSAFIVPFLLVYISFTVFETWVLHQMAIMRKA